ncbi:MAG: neutral ceramidase [Solirubrobacterales bacterium]|nr:neutral ceramidase [Solirubrobacterales bacterium]
MGWVRSDAKAEGQLTRLFARSIVLERGDRKLALVAADLGFVPAGLVADVVDRLEDRGFGEESVIISASHTHSAPAGYANFPAFNTVAPTSTTPTEFELSSPADPVLYTFLVKRIATAIRRADSDRAPAVAGWGETKLFGVTQNRSIEAHLAMHQVYEEFGQGSVEQDPKGERHTIDPQVHVLRVDKVSAGRNIPIGIWSTFANHGTVVKPTFAYYNADHHAAAARLAEAAIRREGHVPRRQEVVNAYGNADEGDMTAGLRFSGPADAYDVGRREAKAFVSAWNRAGGNLTATPKLDSRWTIECFCGSETEAGPVDDHAVVGMPFLTGSEENRGPLFDITGVPFEGNRLPVGVGPQGVKIQSVPDTGSTFPTAVPLTTAQVDDRAIVTIPGEMTSGMGRTLRAHAEDAVEGSGIERVVISGLANDFIQYFTSPEEYDRQHYEGGSTLFGRASSIFIEERLIALLELMIDGEPAPAPDEDERRNGIEDDAPPFGTGATAVSAIQQPSSTRRLDRASFEWQGGPDGTDRPLDRAFVIVQRRARGHWRAADSDLGLNILWTVDENDAYEAFWEAPRSAPLGRYRFKIRANGYKLKSKRFRLRAARDLEAKLVAQSAGRAVIELRYPEAVENVDLTWRPKRARIWSTRLNTASVNFQGHRLVVQGKPGEEVRVSRGALGDRDGNRNGNALTFELSRQPPD